jgi:hypothetical protein
LPVTDYWKKLEFAVNKLNAVRMNKFEFIDFAERRNEFLGEIEFFKKQGRLN